MVELRYVISWGILLLQDLQGNLRRKAASVGLFASTADPGPGSPAAVQGCADCMRFYSCKQAPQLSEMCSLCLLLHMVPSQLV